jgi:hypothetical protein
MPPSPDTHQPAFKVFGFMSSLKAARDLGLDARAADEIALRFDPRTGDREHIVDALAAALFDRGVLEVPDSA